MAQKTGYSEGRISPASVKAELGHQYRWLVDGNTYQQIGTGVTNTWVQVGSSGHIEYLNDLLDVTITTPINGDALQFLNGNWINAPIVAGVDTLVSNSLFVSSKGVDVSQGAERENLSVHFNNINQARDAASPMLVTGGNVIANGSGYIFPGTNVATTPVNIFSTGSGLTVDYFTIGFGIGITVNNPGTGYVNGESVTVNGGDNLMTFELIVEQVKDTIYVFGNAISNGNLAKQNTNYVFSGKGTITGTSNMWDDENGAITEMHVRGDAFFNVLTSGRFAVDITGFDTHYDIECYRILGRGGRVVNIQGGQPHSKLKVETDIDNNFNNQTIELAGGAKGTIEVGGVIDNNSLYGGGETIKLGNLNYDYTLIGDLKNNSSGGGIGFSTISNFNGSHTAALKIIGDVYANPLTNLSFFTGPSVMQIHCNLELTGNIHTASRAAWSSTYFPPSMEIIHTGNIYSDYPGSLFMFIENNPYSTKPIVIMNGDIYSTAAAGPVVIQQAEGKFRFNGKVHNTFNPAGPGSVAQATVASGGTGYPGQSVVRNVTTTSPPGSLGTGLTFMIWMSSTNPNVRHVAIDAPGVGYAVGEVVTISGAGNGDATARINAVGVSGIILKASDGVLTSNTLVGGTGYTNPGANEIATSGGTGTGLIVNYVTVGLGVITGYTIVNPGGNYTINDIITILDGNNDATFKVTKVDGQYDTIFDNALIVVDAVHGDEVGLGAYNSDKPTVITNQVASNKVSINITNLITGTDNISDPQIQ